MEQNCHEKNLEEEIKVHIDIGSGYISVFLSRLCSCCQNCFVRARTSSLIRVCRVQMCWLSVVALFPFMSLKLEMCAVYLVLKVLLVSPVCVSCLSLFRVAIAW